MNVDFCILEQGCSYGCLCISSRELGRQAVEEKQRQQELYEKGYALRQQYSTQGKIIKENNKVIYCAVFCFFVCVMLNFKYIFSLKIKK